MAEFELIDHLSWQYYEAEFDRILTLQPGVDMPAIHEAAFARSAYSVEHFTDPSTFDKGLLDLPVDIPNMALNTVFFNGLVDLLDDYIEKSFEYGRTKDPSTIALNRERAKYVVTELQMAARVFDTVRDVNYDSIFPGEAAA